MPNYHFRIKSSNRSAIKSVKASDHCDYINREGRFRNCDEKTSGEDVHNGHVLQEATTAASHLEYINRESVFQKRGGCVFAKSHLPQWAGGRAKKFFQAADKYERANGERYKEIEFALPNELSLEENKKIVEEFVNRHLQDFYYAYAIHDKIGSMSNGERQTHVHIMFSTREIDEVERQQERPPELFFRQYNRKHPEKGGCQKSWRWNSSDRKKYLLRLRKDYARIQNEALERNGINLRVDHRTLKAQREEALATGNYLLADLLDKMPEEYVGPVELQKEDSQLVIKQKQLRGINHQREKTIIARFIAQNTIDKDSLEEKARSLLQRQERIFALEHDIEAEAELAYFKSEKQEIQAMQKDMKANFAIALWAPQAIELACLDGMTTEEKELWQDLKSHGREKREWEILKNRMAEPPASDPDALSAYLRICPEIDKELDKTNLKIRQAAAKLRPVFERLNLPHNKAAIQKQAAFYINDNRLVKTNIKRLQWKMDEKLNALEKNVNEYFAVSQKNRSFSLEEVASILKGNLARQEEAVAKLDKELYHMRKRVISYPRAIEMAKNNYVNGAFKDLRADKRALKKWEDELSPEERKQAWLELEKREQALEARCRTETAKAKIEVIAAGILRKNAPIAKEYRELSARRAALKDSIIENKFRSQRVEAKAPLEQGSKFRTAPPADPTGSGGGGSSLPTPSRSADLISKAIAGGPKEAQLVARSRPEEPDEWMWLSEAEKDDLRYDMSRIDRW